MRQKRVFLLSGIPGSGKSTWVNKQLNDSAIRISRDVIRFELLNDNDDYFSKEDKVFSIFVNRIQKAINSPDYDNIYIDATHLSTGSRRKILNRLNLRDSYLICVHFDIPLNICLKRNSYRIGKENVPEEQIRNMYQNFSYPTRRENFDEIWVVNQNEEVKIFK